MAAPIPRRNVGSGSASALAAEIDVANAYNLILLVTWLDCAVELRLLNL
jgi:hypothetical protein